MNVENLVTDILSMDSATHNVVDIIVIVHYINCYA